MVSVRKYIYNERVPRQETVKKYCCDQCGCECLPSGQGMRHELLYQYDVPLKDGTFERKELCYNCFIELLFDTADYAVVAE